jgi:adhesin/invasin
VSSAQLMIGGQSAQVNFSGLTPGFAGLYQVNAVVPAGTETGANVPVTLAIAGQTSPPVTLSIQ